MSETITRKILSRVQAVDVAPFSRLWNILDTYKRIRPGFSSSWLSPNPPSGAKPLARYTVEGSQVTIYDLPNETESLYLVAPFEHHLPLNQIRILDLAKQEIVDRYPETLQLANPEQAREYVRKQAMRVIPLLSKEHGIPLAETSTEEVGQVRRLAEVLAKYTAGLGITENILRDNHVQDMYVDAPAEDNIVYITVGAMAAERVRGKCKTNIRLGADDARSLLARFRYESGRPFSEARPILECDLEAFNTRATVIGPPLSPQGIAIALRRHSQDPWTLPRFIANRMISPMAAGLLSFLIDGKSTFLVSGSRGAGKTSLLGSLLLELPQSQRILTIEDTLELPTAEMQKLGYKVQSMHIQSSTGGLGEMSATDALITALRLGESVIVLGEVRGEEARTLYEAMRAGTAGSSVFGTIHGNSASAVYERVVHDMGINPKAFNATDCIVICGLRRPGGVQTPTRRVVQITEVKKERDYDDEMFQDLMLYDGEMDTIVETELFRNDSERIQKICDEWGITLEEGIQNIAVRAAIRKNMVKYAQTQRREEILGASWVAASNNAFWGIIEKHNERRKKTHRDVNYRQVLEDWNRWFEGSVAYG